jgi:hypothetical protein
MVVHLHRAPFTVARDIRPATVATKSGHGGLPTTYARALVPLKELQRPAGVVGYSLLQNLEIF